MISYPLVLIIHMIAATVSGLYFFARGSFLLLGADWPKQKLVKITSYIIDTILLTAAIILCFISPADFSNGWLHAKIFLVVIYILLGVFAMREKLSKPIRISLFLLAIFIFINILGIAIHHSPLGWFA